MSSPLAVPVQCGLFEKADFQVVALKGDYHWKEGLCGNTGQLPLCLSLLNMGWWVSRPAHCYTELIPYFVQVAD